MTHISSFALFLCPTVRSHRGCKLKKLGSNKRCKISSLWGFELSINKAVILFLRNHEKTKTLLTYV